MPRPVAKDNHGAVDPFPSTLGYREQSGLSGTTHLLWPYLAFGIV